jgi:adenylate kinase family enzyme
MIVQRYGVVHISTGDILRENVKAGTDLGKKVRA